jgi:hypothetical protein
MSKLINWYVLVLLLIAGFIAYAQSRNTSKYKYLFRNVILSNSGKYELARVLSGRIYYPRYYFIPSMKQYLVYSDVDETGDFKVDDNKKSTGKTYSLLDENGNIKVLFETSLSFSNRSGCFYGIKTYIPLLETGTTDELPYDYVHNSELNLKQRDFEKLFIQLYTSSDYVEFINLRILGDQIHEAGVVFKRQGKMEILLSGVRDSRMVREFHEDKKTNNFQDYYSPDISKRETFPQSKPAIEMIALETSDTNPFVHWRTGFNREFRIKKYTSTYSSGWQGIMKIGGIPVYVPGENAGTTCVRFRTKGETFRIKILEIQKYGPTYNLGLRTFQLPENVRTNNSLTFMESAQNCGSNRLGGGVFVVRPATTGNPSADIPSDMTEEHFNTLPLPLQNALLDPNAVTSLKMYEPSRTRWIPEIERLKNLTHLEMTTSMSEIPDEISKLPKLQSLSMTMSKIQKVSVKIAELKELEVLDLFSNKLTEFPLAVLELKNLKVLRIGGNDIKTLPDDINKLVQLERLGMTSTDITSLPESMIGMKKLFIDCMGMEKEVPSEYQHLFDYDKIPSPY